MSVVSIPGSHDRLYLPIEFGPETGEHTVDFLYDSGSTITGISPATAALAEDTGIVQAREPGEHLTGASGALIPTGDILTLRLRLSDGFTFQTKCQIINDLPQDGLLGENVISALKLVADHDRKCVIRNPVISGGSILPAECMSLQDFQCDTVPDKVRLNTKLFGPLVDVTETPLVPHDQLYTFHVREAQLVPPKHFAKLEVQAFNPDGSLSSVSTDFIMQVAPEGSLASHRVTDGKTFVIVTNKTDKSQEFIPQFPVAIGCSIKNYFKVRGFKNTHLPKPFRPANACSVSHPTKEVPPEVMSIIKKQVKSVPIRFRNSFQKLLVRYHHIIARNKYDIGLIPDRSHTIHMEDKTPVYNKQFPIPAAYNDQVRQHLKDLEAAGLIERTKSPYNSPLFCVPKGDAVRVADGEQRKLTIKEIRVVQDFRQVNAKTLPDKYSIRTVESCLASVGHAGGRFFSTIDLSSAFWQMSLDKDSKPFTAFTVPGFGQFQWTRGAMGLTGCPATFARIMDDIMHGLPNVLCYIDDILVHTPSMAGQLRQLELVFSRLAANNIKINVSKSCFLKTSVSYLGYQISSDGIRPGRVKADVLSKAPVPKTANQLRSFIGLCSFFRSFVPNFAMRMGPLYEVVKVDPTWNHTKRDLTQNELKAFHDLKDHIAALPRLAFPTPHGQLHVFVDAALGDDNHHGGIGAVLFQEQGPDKIRVPLGFASRRLRDAERRYPIFCLELQAAVYGIQTFDHLLRGQHFHLYTDHKPLTHHTKMQGRTLNRLQEELGRHNCTIHYVAAKDNTVADFLSRFSFKEAPTPDNSKDPFRPCHKEAATAFRQVASIQVSSLTSICSHQEIHEAQLRCPQTGPLIQQMAKGQPVKPPNLKTRDIFMHNNLLCSSPKGQDKDKVIFVPTELRRKYMMLAHRSVGHGGYEKTLHRIRPFAYWPDMDADIRMFLHTCGPCSIKTGRHDTRNGKMPIHMIPTELRPNERVHLDLFGPLDVANPAPDAPKRTKRYVLVMTCALTKIVRLVIIPDKEATTVSSAFVDQWCHIFGNPKTVVTDQGLEFTNDVLKSILDERKVSHSTTTAYHPQANGQAEVFNRTMGRFLRAMLTEDRLDRKDWPSLISLLQFTYNTSLHRTIKTTPFEVLFGYDPRVPGFPLEESLVKELDLVATPETRWLHAKTNIDTVRKQQTDRANKGTYIPDFQPGDKVLWLKDQLDGSNPKLQPKWVKATVVRPALQRLNYYIKPQSGKRTSVLVHVSKIKFDTTSKEEVTDPSYKMPYVKSSSSDRVLRPRKNVRLPQVSSVAPYVPPPPGTTWNKRDLAHMFAAFAAHQLAPPSFETEYIPEVNGFRQLIARLPDAAGTHNIIIPEPVNEYYESIRNLWTNNPEDRDLTEELGNDWNLSLLFDPPTFPVAPQIPPAQATEATPVAQSMPQDLDTPQGAAALPATPKRVHFPPDDSLVSARSHPHTPLPTSKLVQFDFISPRGPAHERSEPPVDSLTGTKRAWRRTSAGSRFQRLAREPPSEIVTEDFQEMCQHSRRELLETIETLMDIWVPSHASYAPDVHTAHHLTLIGISKASNDMEARRLASQFIIGTTRVINDQARKQWNAELDSLLDQAFSEADRLYKPWYPDV